MRGHFGLRGAESHIMKHMPCAYWRINVRVCVCVHTWTVCGCLSVHWIELCLVMVRGVKVTELQYAHSCFSHPLSLTLLVSVFFSVVVLQLWTTSEF